MSRKVEIRKNIIIKIEFNQSSSSEQTINLDFIPDEVNVKYSQYLWTGRVNSRIISANVPANVNFTGVDELFPVPQYDGETNQETNISLVYCDLVNDHIATVVDSPQIQTYNTAWTLGKPVKGVYVFTITGKDEDVDTSRRGTFIIHFEFLKYK